VWVWCGQGERVGPVLGITACLHGNELNGIPLIHRLFRELDCAALSGTVVAVPVANAPGFLRTQRGYLDGADLNRMMPGKKGGTAAQAYAHALMDRIVARFEYLIDMHTASTGRINSLYVRADMRHPVTARMAILQNPQVRRMSAPFLFMSGAREWTWVGVRD
jgi:predicted deacylase